MNKQKNKINFTFFTNFNPYHLNKIENNFFRIKNKKKIFCKNFFLFLFLLKFLKLKFNNSNFFIWIKPIKKSKISLLRAPYRHKLTKIAISFKKYFITLSINISDFCVLLNKQQFTNLIYFFSKNIILLESNIIYNSSINFFLFFYFSDLFLY